MTIDIHAHLRDGEKQSYKETVKHGLETAWKAGISAVFEMPNTDPALTSRKAIDDRLFLGDDALLNLEKKYPEFDMFHGIFAGITADERQIEEVVGASDNIERVVGLKMFAGHSTGAMGLVDDEQSSGEEKQKLVYQTLAGADYRGVLAVHCEKEAFLRKNPDGTADWKPFEAFTHTLARPPEAEVGSVKDQIKFAQESGYKGTLHICHLSVPESLEYIESKRGEVDFDITTEATPHHCMLYDEMMKKEGGLLMKMNPPLRPQQMQEFMMQAVLDRRIDMYGSDHAPHTLDDKLDDLASGVPTLSYHPFFIKELRERGASDELIDDYTHNNAIRIFGLDLGRIANNRLALQKSEHYFINLIREYEFDPFWQAR